MVHHADKLEELALLGLSMTLRREASKDLREELARQIKAIIAKVEPGHTPEETAAAMATAAKDCILVLRVAKEQRKPRPPGNAPHPHHAAHHPHHAAHPPKDAEMSNAKVVKIVVGVVVLLLAAGGLAWWSGKETPNSDGSETTKFVEQIIQATQGEPPATHMFGGTLKVTSMGGVPVVIAEKVPPRICAASGMKLVKKGLLSVNGVTPTRVSSAIITELCNKDDGDATIMWAPK
ncbi:hypothetical protein [Paramagnetospirillum kuznetsovii]|nr:hypothetical protein [Paramagnetospirillum kuznetsovii]